MPFLSTNQRRRSRGRTVITDQKKLNNQQIQ